MDTHFYIDGFNLYYGCLAGTPYRWLNLETLCANVLPRHNVTAVKYFTARISAQPWDPPGPQRVIRQQVYLRALATLPLVTTFFGHFQTSEKWLGLVQPPKMKPSLKLAPGAPVPQVACVLKSEEKGSDVNLATQLLHDAHLKRFQQAVVISADSDLANPIIIVTQELGLPVGIVSPRKNFVRLGQVASFKRRVRTWALAASQFANTLSDANGTFTKPTTW